MCMEEDDFEKRSNGFEKLKTEMSIEYKKGKQTKINFDSEKIGYIYLFDKLSAGIYAVLLFLVANTVMSILGDNTQLSVAIQYLIVGIFLLEFPLRFGSIIFPHICGVTEYIESLMAYSIIKSTFTEYPKDLKLWEAYRLLERTYRATSLEYGIEFWN
jgi:hypothetical protein